MHMLHVIVSAYGKCLPVSVGDRRVGAGQCLGTDVKKVYQCNVCTVIK